MYEKKKVREVQYKDVEREKKQCEVGVWEMRRRVMTKWTEDRKKDS